MRIIVFGNRSMSARLTSLLSEDNIEVIEAVITNRSDPAEVLPEGGFDLIVVEGDEEDVAGLCRSLRQCLGEVPVALVVNRNHTDWTKVVSADADGYLYMEGGNTEMKARVKAIMRSSVPGVS